MEENRRKMKCGGMDVCACVHVFMCSCVCVCAKGDGVDIAGFDVSGNTGSASVVETCTSFLRGLVAISRPIDRIVRSISFVHRDGAIAKETSYVIRHYCNNIIGAISYNRIYYWLQLARAS